MVEKIFTNCFLIKTDSTGKPVAVCLAMKKRDFGKDLYNGSGGKPQEGEDIDTAAKREVEEELGVRVVEMTKRAEIEFYLSAEDKMVLMHAFLVTGWEGEPTETEEMAPEWFPVNQVPYAKMWQSDAEWLPLVLAGQSIQACYTYACEGGEVQSRKIVEVGGF